jgi:hypothetical protein
MKRIIIIFALAIIILANPLVLAQTDPAKVPVDESTVIFAGCRLSVLVDKTTGTPIKESKSDEKIDQANQLARKQTYVKGCIQDIIRFIIVIASLAAILKIAVTGIQGMYQDNSKQLRGTVTNLVIGLFLLIVGWNLIPILNNSFNNVDFLNLPSIGYCSIQGGCQEENYKKQRYEGCTDRYETIMDEKLYDTTKANREILIKCIIEFCGGPVTAMKDGKRLYDFGDDTCEDIGKTKDIKVVSKLIDDYIKEGEELRKKNNTPADTPAGDLEAEVIKLVKAGKINQIDGQPEKIIEQINKKLLKNVTLKFLAGLAKSPGVESIKIWEPFREEKPPKFHGKGLAVDLKSVTMGGVEYTTDDAFKGKTTEQFIKIAELIYDLKTTRQIIMAGDKMVNTINKLPHFNAGPRKGTIENIRIATTPGEKTPTDRHEDHWHVDMFE